MSYIAPIEVEDGVRSLETYSAINEQYAVEAAKVIFARSPAHAKRFALAMHKRVATGLDCVIIEHWARVVTEIGRMM